MNVRGLIEGFYGPPWSHDERLDLIRFCGDHGLNTWVHAPKDDPFHRQRWRDPYPDDELQRIAQLVGECVSNDVEFVYAIAPGLDICYSREDEFDALLAKCHQLKGIGVNSFQLLWDDIEHTLSRPEDERLYGEEARPSAAAQAPFTNRFADEFEQPGPLVVCPMGYAGTADSPYRQIFGARLDPDIVVYWTGPEVVSIGVTREELDVAVNRFHGHELLLWDNYPANDSSPELLYLGPLRGRDPRLADGNLRGIMANPMVQAVPSKLALATIADWAADPAAYDAVASYERALQRHGAEVVEALRQSGARSNGVSPPDDVPGLVQALAAGVDAGTGIALLEPFV
jgi:hyaluronoglucosaminidase